MINIKNQKDQQEYDTDLLRPQLKSIVIEETDKENSPKRVDNFDQPTTSHKEPEVSSMEGHERAKCWEGEI